MARFTASANEVSPLLIQLTSNTAGAGSYGSVFAARAGAGEAGSISRPAIYRPSTAGTGTNANTNIRAGVPGSTPQIARYLTVFATSPVLPTLSTGSFGPIRISWMVPSTRGLVFMTGQSAVLYAVGADGASWSGELSWEEF